MAADGSVVIGVKMNTSQADKDMARIKRDISSIEDTISEQEAKKSPLTAQAEALNQKMKEARVAARQFGQQWVDGVAGADGQQAKAVERLSQIETEYAKIVEEIDKIDRKLLPAYEKLDRMKEEAGGLEREIRKASVSTEKMEKATKRVNKLTGTFGTRLRGILLSAFVFNVISAGLRSFTQWLGKAVLSNEQAASAVARLKGALLTLAQPLLEVIIPAFTAFINVLASLVSKVAGFIAALFGTTYESASDSAEALYNEQNAIEGVGSAAKKSAKSLAAFDEINRLSGENASSGGAGGGSTGITPNFDTVSLTDGMSKVLDIVEKISATLLGWGFSKLFLSGLERLTGLNIPAKVSIGISLVAAGTSLAAENIASILSGEYDHTSLRSAISSSVAGIMTGAGLVALGASLWAIPIAIVAAFTVTDLIVNWDQYKAQWSYELEAAKAFLAGDSEGFWGNASDAFLVWLKTDSWVQKLGKTILGDDVWERAIAYLEGGGTFDRAFSTLWENVKEWFSQQTWHSLAANGFLGIGSAFAAWAKTGFPPKVQQFINWIKQNLFNHGFFNMLAKNSFSGVLDYLGGNYYKEWKSKWSNTATALKGILNGMITHFERFVNYCITALNKLISGINRLSEGGNGLLGLFTIPKIPSASLPRLATGTVVPPNREFMAVLGDNKTETEVVSPLSTMKQAMLEALRESSGFGGGSVTVVVNLDGKEVARNQVKHINDMTRAAGKPVLLF